MKIDKKQLDFFLKKREIEDYYNLYKDEVDKENESLKKQTIQ